MTYILTAGIISAYASPAIALAYFGWFAIKYSVAKQS